MVALASVGVVSLAVGVVQDVDAGNWEGVAYDAGAAVGSAITGGAMGRLATQIERLNKLTPVAGERHDAGNIAVIDR